MQKNFPNRIRPFIGADLSSSYTLDKFLYETTLKRSGQTQHNVALFYVFNNMLRCRLICLRTNNGFVLQKKIETTQRYSPLRISVTSYCCSIIFIYNF